MIYFTLHNSTKYVKEHFWVVLTLWTGCYDKPVDSGGGWVT